MEILTIAELQARLKTSHITIAGWRRLGMPALTIPVTRGKGKPNARAAVRFIFEDVISWLKDRSGYPTTSTTSTTTKEQ